MAAPQSQNTKERIRGCFEHAYMLRYISVSVFVALTRYSFFTVTCTVIFILLLNIFKSQN